MTDDLAEPLAVHRLLPGAKPLRTLMLGYAARDRVTRWLTKGGAEPASAHAGWTGYLPGPAADFPSGLAHAPVLGPRILDALRNELPRAGRLIPVTVENPDDNRYRLYLVNTVVDCLDRECSMIGGSDDQGDAR